MSKLHKTHKHTHEKDNSLKLELNFIRSSSIRWCIFTSYSPVSQGLNYTIVPKIIFQHNISSFCIISENPVKELETFMFQLAFSPDIFCSSIAICLNCKLLFRIHSLNISTGAPLGFEINGFEPSGFGKPRIDF